MIEILRPPLLVAFVSTAIGAPAWADDNDVFPPPIPAWQEECGSCHLAYPPQLLPAASWKNLFSGLTDHFGSDASVDAALSAELLDYAVTFAGRPPRSGNAPQRISESRWFLHEHDEVSTFTWTSAPVSSPANCGACHQSAEQGDFSERNLKIPR